MYGSFLRTRTSSVSRISIPVGDGGKVVVTLKGLPDLHSADAVARAILEQPGDGIRVLYYFPGMKPTGMKMSRRELANLIH